MEDLDEAITYNCEALRLCPLGHPGRSTSLNNLANGIFTRYKQFSRMEDLEDVIRHRREALSLHPADHPDCSKSLNGLASAVLARHVQSGGAEDLKESFMLYEQAIDNLAASSESRLTAAIEWAGTARQHHHSSVMCAYSISLHLLDRCLISYPKFSCHCPYTAFTCL